MKRQITVVAIGLVLFLGCGITSRAAAQLACGGEAGVGSSTPVGRIVFVTYGDASEVSLPSWADDFAASFADYMTFVSNGSFSMTLEVMRRLDEPGKAWENPSPSTIYRNVCASGLTHYGHANAWWVEEIYNHYDAAGEPDVWASVDAIIVIHYKKVFGNAGPVMGVGNLGTNSVPGFNPVDFGFTAGGASIMMHPDYTLNELQQLLHKEGAAAHEFGHAVGFSHIGSTGGGPGATVCGNPPTEPDWVNMGHYSIMDSWNPAPYEGYVSYHPAKLKSQWVPTETVAPQTCYQTVLIPDIRDPANGKIVKVPIPGTDQYFLMANHQQTGYDSKYGGSGLAIWHIWPSGAWDLESSEGKIIDPSGAGGTPDPNTWWDHLEADFCWVGSGIDLWDGSPGRKDFNPGTNPNTNLYAGTYQVQDVPSNIHIDNIRYEPGTSDILVDIAIADWGFITPAAGDRVADGDQVELNWAVCSEVVDILISDETGSNLTVVEDDEPNDGTFTYTMQPGSPLGDGYFFRIIPDNDPNFSFDSEAFSVWDIANLSIDVRQDCGGNVGFDVSWETTEPSNGNDQILVISPSYTTQGTLIEFSDDTAHDYTLWAGDCEVGDWTYYVISSYSVSGEVPYSSTILVSGTIDVDECTSCPPCRRNCNFEEQVADLIVDPVRDGYLVKEFSVERGSRIQGVRLLAGEATGTLAEVVLLRDIGIDPEVGPVLARVQDIVVGGSSVAEMKLPSVLIDEDSKVFVAVKILAAKRGQGHGVAAFRDGGTTSYLLPGAGPPIDLEVDLAVELVLEGESSSSVTKPARTFLKAGVPNPFTSSTVMRFGLAAESRVEIQVYDVTGRLVSNLLDRHLPAGTHHVQWDGRSESGQYVSPGIYFLRLKTDSEQLTQKVVRVTP